MRNNKEQWFCTEIQKYIRAKMCFSGPIEAKVSYSEKLNYKNAFKEHQLRNLINARNVCMTYKLSDMDRMQKPWDLEVFCKAESWVAIYWVIKGNKEFYLINPSTIQGEIDDGKKSLTIERARQLATHICQLA